MQRSHFLRIDLFTCAQGEVNLSRGGSREAIEPVPKVLIGSERKKRSNQIRDGHRYGVQQEEGGEDWN